MKSNSLTTTNIGTDELKHLKKLASRHKLKQSEFINASINYFQKTGINPAEEIFSPREEIERLTKRVDEVIKFLQVHEKQKLTPLLERLILMERKLGDTYSKVITADDLKPIGNLTIQLGKQLEIQLNKLGVGINRVPETVKPDVDAIYRMQKNTILLIALFFESMKNKGMAGFNKEDIKRFEDALSKIR